jgi:hypothetical protein
VVELGFLPILPPFRYGTRPMSEAYTFSLLFQASRIGNGVELVKGRENEVSNLLNSSEEGLIAQTLSSIAYPPIGSVRTNERKSSTTTVRATVTRLHKVQVHCP